MQNLQTVRQHSHGILARAEEAQARPLWEALAPELPAYTRLRGPEPGMVMVQGRIAGDGSPFALGEATVTRCTIQLSSGVRGTGHVLGRNAFLAEVTAVADALVQEESTRHLVEKGLLQPLSALQKKKARLRDAETAATRVDFFTLVRGD